MKRLFLTIALLTASLSAWALTPNKVVFPDIEGYKTLKGDFHIHTVFSDASVWPATRVTEAIWEGLDVIAITEHIDTRHQKLRKEGLFTDKCDRDCSYRIAAKAAKRTDLIVIQGGEITREMSPGHFNFIFVKDNDEICRKAELFNDSHPKAAEEALKEAQAQGGFAFWNHPQWNKHAPNETKWYKEHTKFLKAGLFNGIEVYNMEYCPEAHDWALKYNLTMFGNSDAHEPFFSLIDYQNGGHRPLTLVFAKERSEKGVREALDDRRTVVFAEKNIYGREDWVRKLYEASVKIKNVRWTEKRVYVTIENLSSVPVRFAKAPGAEQWSYQREAELPPLSTATVVIAALQKDHKYQPITADEVQMNVFVENFHIGAHKPLEVKYTFKRK